MVQTQSGTLGQVVQERYIQELPLNGRNAATLIRMVPGAVTGVGTGNAGYANTSETINISVNGSRMDVEVPSATAKAPLVLDHEGLTIIVASEEQIDGMFFAEDSVYFGVLGILADGKPVAAAGVKTCLKVNLEGEVKQLREDITRLRK